MPRARREDKPPQQKITLSLPEGESKEEIVKALETIAAANGLNYNGAPSVSRLMVEIAKHSFRLENIMELIKANLPTVPTETLKALEFYQSILPQMPHYQIAGASIEQKSIDADTLRLIIQLELDSRQAGELPYAWDEMYLSVGIPKEFLN